MTGFEPFSYSTAAAPPQIEEVNRLKELPAVKDRIPLSGLVKGKRASDLEERFARGLTQAGLKFSFQIKIALDSSLPGQEKVIDFIVDLGWRYAVEIDGVIAHRTAAQQGKDLVREILLNHSLVRSGIFPIQRVKWWQLETQEMADRAVREMFGGKG